MGKEDASTFCPDDGNSMVQGEDAGQQYQLCPLNLTTASREGQRKALDSIPCQAIGGMKTWALLGAVSSLLSMISVDRAR